MPTVCISILPVDIAVIILLKLLVWYFELYKYFVDLTDPMNMIFLFKCTVSRYLFLNIFLFIL